MTPFDGGMPGLIAPAFAAGLIVAATHVPLGREVLKRGIIFLDLAVAQIAGLGAVAAGALLSWDGIGARAAAFVFALAAALFFSRLERKGQATQEALIGCGFVLAAALSVLAFAGDPHGGEEISNLMAGQILWTGWTEAGLAALASLPVLAALRFFPVAAKRHFYLLFAVSITVSVQMVGVYLVFASLILPALASEGRSVRTGYLVSLLAVSGGLVFSALTDLPSGPVLVCAYVLAALAARGLVMSKIF